MQVSGHVCLYTNTATGRGYTPWSTNVELLLRRITLDPPTGIFSGNTKTNIIWTLLSSVQVHKLTNINQLIKYTETIEHHGLEVLTGDPVQKAIWYLKNGKTQYEQ